jgi:hypothetical protein
MNVLPTTKQDRLSLALYPFKAFIIAVPIVLVVSAVVTELAGWNHSESARHAMFWEWSKWFSMCEKGYLVSIVGLIVGGSYLVDKRARRSAGIFVVLAVVSVVLLHPAMQPVKTRAIARGPNPCVEGTEASLSVLCVFIAQGRLASAAHAGCSPTCVCAS